MSAIALARGALVQVIAAERRHATTWLRRAVQESDRRVKGERGDTYGVRQAKRHLRRIRAAQEALAALGVTS